MNHRDGFSLVECLVAAVLLAAGLLTISASGRAMQQLDLLGARTAGAAEVAASRIAALRTAACAGPSTGLAAGMYDERWSVTASGSLRSMALDVSFIANNRSHTVRYEAAWRCEP
jgi:prepilin-type N-terminal cleavage/methylation domain-containing protein